MEGHVTADQLRELRRFVDRRKLEYQQCKSDVSRLQDKSDEAGHNYRIYAQATKWLKDLYEQTQERFHGQIMQIVTYCLHEVFGPDAYDFKIVFEQKRNQVEASMWFEKDGELYDPLNAVGGGVLSVACFALRLAVIYLTRSSVRSIMVLDEPFSQLSVEYREAMAILLQGLAKKFNFQFIMITHASEFVMGKVHILQKD